MALVILVPSLTVSAGLVLLSVALMRYLRYLKRAHDAVHLPVRDGGGCGGDCVWVGVVGGGCVFGFVGVECVDACVKRAAPLVSSGRVLKPRRPPPLLSPPAPPPRPQEGWKRRHPPGLISDGSDRVLREVAVAVTDVEGSTELWEWDREVMARALEVHDNVMREEISRCAVLVGREG